MKITRKMLFLCGWSIFCFWTPNVGLATHGDPSFFNVDYTKGVSVQLMEEAKAGVASGQEKAAQSVVSRFAILPNDEGRTLFPSGTRCDSVEVREGKMKVFVLLPENFNKGDITVFDLETAGEILRYHFAEPELLQEIRFVSRIQGSKSAWKSLVDFVVIEKPIQVGDEDWYEPDGPGPQSSPDYHAPFLNKNVTGQGPLGTSGQPQGALSGRTVFFSGGHGWVWTGTGWGLARPRLLQMNEDHGNIDAINFFAYYLFNAGATVVPMRPLGHQENEVVLDNTNPAVSWSGAWSNSSNPRYYGSGSPPYRYTDTSPTETATATYTPNIPVAGFYPVYCWANYGSDRVSNQLYRILHSGGESQVRINHRRVGCGWIWLGNYYFQVGSHPMTGSVVISNQSNNTGIVIADAIRFGNGAGDVNRGGGVSGYLRETECSRYWVQQAMGTGGSSSVYDTSSNDNSDNVGTPPRMAAQMRRDDDQGYNGDIYLGYHSNASSGSARGCVALITTYGPPDNGSTYASLVGTEVRDDCLAEDGPGHWPRTWISRGVTYSSGYGEFSAYNLNSEMCGTIIEVAFHDNADDALLLRDPRVRNVTARACYQAIVRYFNQFDGNPLVFLPEPPVRPRALNNGEGGVVISWSPGASGGAGGSAATGYVVYRSPDGLNFGNPVTTSGTSVTLGNLTLGQTYHFRIAATNAGGESLPTEVLSVRIKDTGPVPILIVGGYDRIDLYNNRTEDRPPMSDVDRLHVRLNNSYDYISWAAEDIASYGEYFDSCSNEAIVSGDVSLGNYLAVIWLVGEESSLDETFSTTEQNLLGAYLDGGGQLFVSGAEIGYDLVEQSGGASFFSNYLKAGYAGDDAATYTAQGSAGIFAGLGSLTFDNGSFVYNVDYPDQLNVSGGSSANMTYTGGNGGTAGIQFEGDFRLVHLGFPWETIRGSARSEVMNRVLDYFDLSTQPEYFSLWELY